jgi:hypothetical protein
MTGVGAGFGFVVGGSEAGSAVAEGVTDVPEPHPESCRASSTATAAETEVRRARSTLNFTLQL